MRIYPAIDLKGGRVVRLQQGLADRETVYFENPRTPAEQWAAAGADWVHVVDLDGAFAGAPANLDAVEKILSVGLKVQLGGGMRTKENVEQALGIGVSRVVIGTQATGDKAFVQELVQQHGEKIAVGIDAKKGMVAVKGWVSTTEITALGLAREMSGLGVQTLIYTDISRDGMLTGPNFEAQEAMLQAVPARVIASGGVSSREDIAAFNVLSRRHPNLDGVIIGKALYDNKVNLADLYRLLKKPPVR